MVGGAGKEQMQRQKVRSVLTERGSPYMVAGGWRRHSVGRYVWNASAPILVNE